MEKKYLADKSIGVNNGTGVDEAWFCSVGSVNPLSFRNIYEPG